MPSVTLTNKIPKTSKAVDRPLTKSDFKKLPAEQQTAFKLAGFEASRGQILSIPSANKQPTEVLIGLGDQKSLDADSFRVAAAGYAKAAGSYKNITTNLVQWAIDNPKAAPDLTSVAHAVVEGLRLSTYSFDMHRAPVSELAKCSIISSESALSAELKKANKIVDAVILARDLTNEPGGTMTPEAFAARAKKVATASGLKCTVWDKARIKREKLGGLLAVNQGSEHPPRFVTLEYKPSGVKKGKKLKHIVLVGKGITFDSGGLSLKTPKGMMTMKADKAGAATVAAAISCMKALNVNLHVTAMMPLTDNMTGAGAQRPGDVFTARNGKTVEVLNTDAEGRLVLADALSLAAELKPDAIIDLATLTGSASVALGMDYTAVLANNDDVAEKLLAAGERTAENLWRFPLAQSYRSHLDSNVADIKNIGGSPYGGTVTAALFLEEFVDEIPWAHMDMGLSALSESEDGIIVKGATGSNVRALVSALVHWNQK